MHEDLEAQGFFVTPALFDTGTCDEAAAYAAGLRIAGAGIRNLLMMDWCRALAARIQTHPLIQSCLSSTHIPVQCILFEKSMGRNWLVPMHQDLSIPVRQKINHPRISGWSSKDGVPYAQAPVDLLEQLLIVRWHIDACGPHDGALRVVPGSHRHGRLDSEEVMAIRKQGEVLCCVERGGCLVMRPLLLHASSKASGASLRRVLHFVFGPSTLPLGLAWPDVEESTE